MEELTKEQKQAKKNLEEAFMYFLSVNDPKALPADHYACNREMRFYLLSQDLRSQEIILHGRVVSKE